ncbi:MAG: hypothetical protein IJE10_09110 [Clostridia bacterium]|nr:hypothetical protein [Clostridia bacterium]
MVSIPEKFKDHPIFNERICGTNFGFLNTRGYYRTENAKKQPELMQKMGINWTTLNINLCQEKVFSTKLFIDFKYTVGEDEIIEMTRLLHEKNVKVLLKPCFTSLDGAPMCCVDFPTKEACRQIEGVVTDYWKEWFASYTESMRYFADLAQRAGVDSMMIGAELEGTAGQDEYWLDIIKTVRSIYDGPITYEFTFASRKKHALEWMKELDYLSYSYYPPAQKQLPDTYNAKAEEINALPTPTVEEMVEFLKPRRDRIKSIIEQFGNKPIVFTEAGVRSSHGCSMLPYNFNWETRYDGEEQANYMEALFRTFHDIPGWMGLFWWKWDETQHRPHYHTEPGVDKGFTIQGKPAEAVLKKWFLKK